MAENINGLLKILEDGTIEWDSRIDHLSDNNYIIDGNIHKNGPLDKVSEEAGRYSFLNGNAKGTSKNFYLDPVPFYNKINQIYTNLIDKTFGKDSARTDSIKMNRRNMDYTNNGKKD